MSACAQRCTGAHVHVCKSGNVCVCVCVCVHVWVCGIKNSLASNVVAVFVLASIARLCSHLTPLAVLRLSLECQGVREPHSKRWIIHSAVPRRHEPHDVSTVAIELRSRVQPPRENNTPVNFCKREAQAFVVLLCTNQSCGSSSAVQAQACVVRQLLSIRKVLQSFSRVPPLEHDCCEGCTCAFVCVWLHRAARVRAASSFDESAHACT
jgi:hypothetical protein